MGRSSCSLLQVQPTGRSQGEKRLFLHEFAGAVVFVHLQDADKKGIEFECYANNICVLKSALSSWYI